MGVPIPGTVHCHCRPTEDLPARALSFCTSNFLWGKGPFELPSPTHPSIRGRWSEPLPPPCSTHAGRPGLHSELEASPGTGTHLQARHRSGEGAPSVRADRTCLQQVQPGNGRKILCSGDSDPGRRTLCPPSAGGCRVERDSGPVFQPEHHSRWGKGRLQFPQPRSQLGSPRNGWAVREKVRLRQAWGAEAERPGGVRPRHTLDCCLSPPGPSVPCRVVPVSTLLCFLAVSWTLTSPLASRR